MVSPARRHTPAGGVPAVKNVLVVKAGQSNWQGGAKEINGPGVKRFRSLRTGFTDPYFGNNNVGQGGGPTSYLMDLLWARGIMADVIDGSIGGASAFLYTGRAGWALTGSATDPANLGYSSTVSYTGSSSAAVLRSGDVGFDPCNLLGRIATMMTQRLSAKVYDDVWILWSQSESDVSYGQAGFYNYWRDALLSVADRLILAGGLKAFFGLSVQAGATTAAQMQFLQLAITEAVAARPWAYKGADLFARYGSLAPLIPEVHPNTSTRVHLDIRGQQVHAHLWDDALRQIDQ